tara:strand:- start:2021 stop:2857 length:837 start_codon:yes stop_codon:yes gene_type:complete
MKTSEVIDFGSRLLRKANINSNRIDSEVLLSHILKINRERLLVHESKLSLKDISKFNKMILRRLKKEPIAYIIKKKEFRSKDFFVSKNSLIPRPETELLIDPILKLFKNKRLFFLDVGIGTGCITYSILNELSDSRGIGIDICKKATSIAKINLKKFLIRNRVKLESLSIDQVFNKKFDLVISNPPYIVKREINQLSEDIKKFEPQKALNGGNDGLDVIKKIIYKSKNILKLNGILALEIGRGQYFSVNEILKLNGFKEIKKIKDYKDNIRCIFSTLL